MTDETQTEWYAVRSIFRMSETEGGDGRPYEERITLWRADSFEDALKQAEAEAIEYTENVGEYLDFGQAFRLFDEPGEGAEIFSLLRDSELEPDEYVTAFFDTGLERPHESWDVRISADQRESWTRHDDGRRPMALRGRLLGLTSQQPLMPEPQEPSDAVRDDRDADDDGEPRT